METIKVERAAGVVTVTLDRPHRKNAATTTTWFELEQTFADIAERTAEDRAVVITGAGDDFCSGADVGDMGEGATMGAAEVMALVGRTCLALHTLPQPTIARVDGVAAGAGLNMALACDLAVATSRARFSEIFARRALSVDFGGSWLLPRLVGMQRAKELVLLADMVDAPTALQMGLVNRVVEPDELDAVVGEWATRLAAGPPIALRQSKQLLNEGAGRTLAEALDAEAVAQVANFGTEDTFEAMSAFVQKRSPTFHGR